jgi:hypothetical protein
MLNELNVNQRQILSVVRFASGFTVEGEFYTTDQPNRLFVLPGKTVTWYGDGSVIVYAKMGLTANSTLPLPGTLLPPFHTSVPSISSHTFLVGERAVLMTPYTHRNGPGDPRFLDEAVVIECAAAEPVYPALHASWPSSITGFTAQDVVDFLDDTWWWYESAAGWTGRYGHPASQMPSDGEPGYGGAMAVVTSFGAMLLCSNRPAAEKLQVQTRMLRMAEDLEKFGVNYDADGGHCNGRYILWKIRQIVQGAPPTLFAATNFSENQQIYDTGGGVPGWRFNTTGTINPTYEFCCTINRWVGAAVCAKVATFLGINTSLWVQYTISYMTANVANPTGWFFSISPRLATIFNANRGLIGF